MDRMLCPLLFRLPKRLPRMILTGHGEMNVVVGNCSTLTAAVMNPLMRCAEARSAIISASSRQCYSGHKMDQPNHQQPSRRLEPVLTDHHGEGDVIPQMSAVAVGEGCRSIGELRTYLPFHRVFSVENLTPPTVLMGHRDLYLLRGSLLVISTTACQNNIPHGRSDHQTFPMCSQCHRTVLLDRQVRTRLKQPLHLCRLHLRKWRTL